MKDFLLSYDQVTLRPKFSSLKSRALADTSVMFGGRKFKLPVVPANMRDVISIDNAKWMSENDYFYIMHRFDNSTIFVRLANHENWKTISISIGVSEADKNTLFYWQSLNYRIDFITIDVAHDHHENVKEMVTLIRERFPKAFLIVGNIATSDAAVYLAAELKVDAIKVGIGGGSICTTRYMTGFHMPTLQYVMEVDSSLSNRYIEIPIIADGGAKHYVDIVKAIRFGATMVMSGGWFASCIDSPAKIIHGKKFYRGSTAYESKGEHKHIEGRTLALDEGFTYSDRLKEIQQ